MVLVTSGPGCSNLVTGLATANSEGDPVVAIGGAVPLANRLKQIHQSMDTVSLFRPITKFSAEIDSPQAVSEVVANAFRAAESGRPGAAFISAPQDIMTGAADGEVLTPVSPTKLGPADAEAIAAACGLDQCAPNGPSCCSVCSRASRAPRKPCARSSPRRNFPSSARSRGRGSCRENYFDYFGGRVGLFHNQPADKLLDAADVVVAVGYQPRRIRAGPLEQGTQAPAGPHRRSRRGHRQGLSAASSS